MINKEFHFLDSLLNISHKLYINHCFIKEREHLRATIS